MLVKALNGSGLYVIYLLAMSGILASCGGGGSGDDDEVSVVGAQCNGQPRYSSRVRKIVSSEDALGKIFVQSTFKTEQHIISGMPASSSFSRYDNRGGVDISLEEADSDYLNIVEPTTDSSGNFYYLFWKADYVIRIDNDGNRDMAFAVGSGADDDIYTLAAAEDASGSIYIGGVFSSYNGIGKEKIARLDSAGSVDLGFTGGFTDGSVNLIVPLRDGSGDLYVAGSFTSYNGITVNDLIRLKADASLDAGFDSGSGINGLINNVILAEDGTGDIYIVGDFSSYNGTTVSNILRLHADGSIDSTFVTGSGFDESPLHSSATMDGTGALLVSGDFTNYDGIAVNPLVRINRDGSLDTPFTSHNIQNQIFAVARDGSGDISLGGEMSNWNGGVLLRRVNWDGSPDPDFTPVEIVCIQ